MVGRRLRSYGSDRFDGNLLRRRAITDSNAYGNRNSNGNSNANWHTNSDCHCDCNTDGYTKRNTAYANAPGQTDTGASPVGAASLVTGALRML